MNRMDSVIKKRNHRDIRYQHFDNVLYYWISPAHKGSDLVENLLHLYSSKKYDVK